MDLLLQEANRAADHTVFVSEWLRDYHASRWFDATKQHSVILNGADPSGLSPDRRVSMETRNAAASRHPPLVGQPEQGLRFLRRDRRGDSVRKRSKHRTLGNRSLAEGYEMAKAQTFPPARERNWPDCFASATDM